MTNQQVIRMLNLSDAEFTVLAGHLSSTVLELNNVGAKGTMKTQLNTSLGEVNVEITLADPPFDMEDIYPNGKGVMISFKGNLDLTGVLAVMHIDSFDDSGKFLSYSGVPLRSAEATPTNYYALTTFSTAASIDVSLNFMEE